MSRDRYRKNVANTHENLLIEERLSAREKALRNLKLCKQREASKQHQVIIIDSKTYALREVGDKPIKTKKNNSKRKIG